jgi:hypothetical protein
MGLGSHDEVLGYIERTGLFETTNFTEYTDEEVARKDLSSC